MLHKNAFPIINVSWRKTVYSILIFLYFKEPQDANLQRFLYMIQLEQILRLEKSYFLFKMSNCVQNIP